MKKILLILTIFPFIISCQDKKVDWAKVNLPIPLDSISKKYKILPYYDYNTQNMELYKSFDKNLLFFDETELDGKVLINNSIVIYVSTFDKNILAITLFTEDKKNTDKLLRIIDKQLGKADYHYYYNDNKKLITTQKIWKKEGKYYTLNFKSPDYIFGEKTKTAQLTIFNSESNVFLKWWFYNGGDFSGYYGQYIDESKKPEHKNKNYTYKDFVEQMDRENKNYGTTSEFFVK